MSKSPTVEEPTISYGWSVQVCRACQSLVVLGHNVGKCSSHLALPRCVALTKAGFTCDGILVELPEDQVALVLATLSGEVQLAIVGAKPDTQFGDVDDDGFLVDDLRGK